VSDFFPGVPAAGAPAVVAADGAGAGAAAGSSVFWQPASAMEAKTAIISKYFMVVPHNWKAAQQLLDGIDYT
jgi:hypothetical protein